MRVLIAATVLAHGFNPALFELKQTSPEHFQGLFRTPLANDEEEPHLWPKLPAECKELQPRTLTSDTLGTAWRFAAQCPAGLAGKSVSVDGFQPNDNEVLFRLEWLDGRSLVRVLRPGAQSAEIPGHSTVWGTLRAYVSLGVEHILTGYDHLAFVLGLGLLARSRRSLAAAITSFTLAHSVTLSATVLGWIHCPQRPAEATIALSIALLGVELARPRTTPPSLGARWPWVVAFAFGLIHGFGFAGALSEAGLPGEAVPLALFGFNVGVELGQLLCVAAAALVAACLHRWIPPVWVRAPRWIAYAMGSTAVFWCFERVSAFWE